MRFRSEKFTFIFIISCLVFGGCRKSDWSTDPPTAEKIAATNKIRRERGVREIKKAWTFYGRRSGAEIWKDQPEQRCKTVHYDKSYDEIWVEHDYYYSGRTFLCIDLEGGTSKEMFRIDYFYGPDRFSISVITDNKQIESMVDGLKEWMKYPSPYDGSYLTYGRMGETNKETLEVADKILKMWGLERF